MSETVVVGLLPANLSVFPGAYESPVWLTTEIASVAVTATIDVLGCSIVGEFAGDATSRFERTNTQTMTTTGTPVVYTFLLYGASFFRFRILTGSNAPTISAVSVLLTQTVRVTTVSGSVTTTAVAEPLQQFRDSSKGVFGDQLAWQPESEMHVTFPNNTYRFQDVRFIQAPIATTAVTVSGNILSATVNAASIGYCVMRSMRPMTYKTGVGMMVRLSSIFTTPTTNTQQWAGVGDSFTGAFIGFNGVTPSICLRRQNAASLVMLRIQGTASAGTTTTTVSLNGTTSANITIANGSTAARAAAQIAYGTAQNWLALGTGVDQGWFAQAVQTTTTDAWVYFLAQTAGSRPTAPAFAVAPTGLTFTITQVSAGNALNETIVASSSFNVHPLDGTTFTENGVTVTRPQWTSGTQMTNGNVLQIRYQYLGFGKLQFAMAFPDGVIRVFHEIRYAGTAALTHMDSPNVPISIEARTTTTGSGAITVSTASFSGISEGPSKAIDPHLSYTTPSLTYQTSQNERVALSLGVRNASNLTICRGTLTPFKLTISTTSNTAGLLRIYYMNASNNAQVPSGGTTTATDFLSWDNVAGTNSITASATAQQSIAVVSTSALTLANGYLAFSATFGGTTNSKEINLKTYFLVSTFHQYLTFTVSGLQNNATFVIGVSWFEDY